MAIIAIISVATSVALATAMEMSSRSVRAELERTAAALAGEAQLSVRGGDLGVPERVLELLDGVTEVEAASPLIEWTVRLEGGRSLHVLGVDFTSDRKLRGYAISDGSLEVRDPVRLLANPDSIVITQELAKALGIGLGDPLPVVSKKRNLKLVVRGVMLPGGVADAYGGQVAAMDIYSLQEMVGRRGWFDQVDIVVGESYEVTDARARIDEALRGVASIAKLEEHSDYADRLFGTIELAVWSMATVGVLVAVFLCYGTMSQAVDRRREEFALLQMIGLEPRRVRRLVRVDALLLSMIGTCIGIATGARLSQAVFSVFSDFLNYLHDTEVHTLGLKPSTVGLALLVGVATSIVASLEPSRRATSRTPLEVLRGDTQIGSSASNRLVVLACTVVAAVAAAALLEIPGLLRLGIVFLGLLAATILLSRALLAPAADLVSRYAGELIPRIGSFVGSSLVARPLHTSFTIGSIAAVLGGLVAILLMLEGIHNGINSWMRSRSTGALIVSASDPYGGSLPGEVIPSEVVAGVKAIAGIDDVVESYTTTIRYRGEEVVLATRGTRQMLEAGRVRLPLLDSDPSEAAAALIRGEILVSQSFARYFSVSVGDSIELDTPGGGRAFRIAALLESFMGPTGFIRMDIDVFDEVFFRPGPTVLGIWAADFEPVIRTIRSDFGARYDLFLYSSEEYVAIVGESFTNFFRLVYIMVAMTGLLGAIAVVDLMLATITERRKELGLLRFAGATQRQISMLTIADAVAVCLVGSGLGVAIGLVVTIPMRDVLFDQMGWVVSASIAPSKLVGLVVVVCTAGALSAVLAARSAGKVGPLQMFSPE